MDCPLYATLEDVLHNCMPAVIIPKKWANVTYKTGRHDIAEILLKVALKHTQKNHQ
jgi:hypothetical protein